MASREFQPKKGLKGDSPVFTPGAASNSTFRKTSALPPQAASAAPFTPRGNSALSTSTSTASTHERQHHFTSGADPVQTVPRADSSAFNLASLREFVPSQASTYNVASARQFTPKSEMSPFNPARFDAVPPAAAPASTSSAHFNPGKFDAVPPAAAPASSSSARVKHVKFDASTFSAVFNPVKFNAVPPAAAPASTSSAHFNPGKFNAVPPAAAPASTSSAHFNTGKFDAVPPAAAPASTSSAHFNPGKFDTVPPAASPASSSSAHFNPGKFDAVPPAAAPASSSSAHFNPGNFDAVPPAAAPASSSSAHFNPGKFDAVPPAAAPASSSSAHFNPVKYDASTFSAHFNPVKFDAVPPAAAPASTFSAPSQDLSSPPATGISANMNRSSFSQDQQQSFLGVSNGPSPGKTTGGPSQATGRQSSGLDFRAAAAFALAGRDGMASLSHGLPPNTEGGHTGVIFDPYNAGPFHAYTNTTMGREGTSYFQGQSPFGTQHQPPAEHLYFPRGPFRPDLLPRHRNTHDFFLPERFRQDVHARSRAANQPSFTLPITMDNYHSISLLDINSSKVPGIFGRVTWLYKAVATKNGNHYCLRRVEDYTLGNENTLRAAREWRRVHNANVVSVIEAFTTRVFGDNSIVFATDYYPLSVTLMQYHFPVFTQNRNRGNMTIQENQLWAYLIQIANALRSIHSANLAARCIDLTKIIRTGKNRIRLSGCAVIDVLDYEPSRVLEHQQQDFYQFGEAMISLASFTPPKDLKRPLSPRDQIPEIYSSELKAAITWLLTPPAGLSSGAKNVETLLNLVTAQTMRFFDMSLQFNDNLTHLVYREVENGRVARMLMKLGTINERENFSRDPRWAEHGPRYLLKLFRDYVFHQVDAQGRPVVSVWHMLSNLSKLDAASNDIVRLNSRDGRTNIYITYKELNGIVQRTFSELVRPMPNTSKRSARRHH